MKIPIVVRITKLWGIDLGRPIWMYLRTCNDHINGKIESLHNKQGFPRFNNVKHGCSKDAYNHYHYKNDRCHGKCISYFNTGKIAQLQTYKNGQHHGEQKTWWVRSGFVHEQNLYDQGKLISGKKWFEHGALQYRLGDIKDVREGSLDVGIFWEFDQDGTLLYAGKFRNGKFYSWL